MEKQSTLSVITLVTQVVTFFEVCQTEALHSRLMGKAISNNDDHIYCYTTHTRKVVLYRRICLVRLGLGLLAQPYPSSNKYLHNAIVQEDLE